MSTWSRTADKVLIAAGAAVLLGLSAPANAAGCGGEYTVQSGDSLSAIARKCGTSVEALMDANEQITSPSRLSVGWTLSVPGSVPGAGGAQVAAAARDGDAVELRGWIVNGQRCAMLATEDGEEYGVVSPELSFVSGRPVAVQGQLVDDPSCSGPKTVLVTQLTTTEL